jgi:hypothetical protein
VLGCDVCPLEDLARESGASVEAAAELPCRDNGEAATTSAVTFLSNNRLDYA